MNLTTASTTLASSDFQWLPTPRSTVGFRTVQISEKEGGTHSLTMVVDGQEYRHPAGQRRSSVLPPEAPRQARRDRTGAQGQSRFAPRPARLHRTQRTGPPPPAKTQTPASPCACLDASGTLFSCPMNTFDVIVIGAGPGGYPAALRAAQLGKRVAIVEQEAFGGTCLNWGCIPTKTLLASSELYHRAAHAARMGVQAASVTFDYACMAARKNEIVGRLTKGVQMLLTANGVTLYSGQARFEDPRRLSVHAADGTIQWLAGERIIIATGSVSAMPGFLPKHPRVLESRAFLDRTALPARLVILGGGVIGCEFACLAAQLGVQVTVVEMLEDIVLVLDRDVRRVLRKRMESLGISILTGAPLTDVTADDRQVSGKYKDQTVAGDLLLVAVGRKPNTAGLELARAGLALNERGQLPVDAQGRTAVATIFAVGDVTAGSTQLAHAATAQGVVAAENAAGLSTRFENTIPACIFTSPEVGTVGMSEAQAQATGRAVKTGLFPFAALGKAMAAGETDGFVKWVADAATDQLLGAQAVGAHATELIAEAAVAIRSELTAEELGRTIHAHPTLSEAWMEAAHMVHGACLHLPPKKK